MTNPWLCGQCGSKLVETIDEQGRVKKRNKSILVVLLLAGIVVPIIIIFFIASTVLVSLDRAQHQSKDARRMADLRQIVSAQELYYGDYRKYQTSVTMPSSIGKYMPQVPTDPKSMRPYGWIDNTTDDQKFCSYAILENKDRCKRQRYYTATEQGNFDTCDVVNWTLDCGKDMQLPRAPRIME